MFQFLKLSERLPVWTAFTSWPQMVALTQIVYKLDIPEIFCIYLFISVDLCIKQNRPKIAHLCDRDSFDVLCWRTVTHFVSIWAFATSQFKVFYAVNNLLSKAEELCVKLFTWIKITFVKNSWKAALDERDNLNPNRSLRCCLKPKYLEKNNPWQCLLIFLPNLEIRGNKAHSWPLWRSCSFVLRSRSVLICVVIFRSFARFN